MAENQDPNRRSANYHPTVWGDHFLAYEDTNPQERFCNEEHEELKEEVRKKLMRSSDKSWQKLNFIDAVQRLGVSYHFQTEIYDSLNCFYKIYDHQAFDDDGDENEELHILSLRFRLLRQHGYHVSCDVFDKFLDPEGEFKGSLGTNIKAMLSLYEAANFRVHEEDILEKALDFTISQLQSILPTLNAVLAMQVSRALDMPIQKTLTWVGARKFMSVYQEDESHDEILLKFAKLDFKLVQKLHQKELCDITKWWKGIDCPGNTPFARDRVAECYLWLLSVYFEPKYSFARTTMAKVLSLTSIIDDIYDVYGTPDELVIFTDAIQRWDIRSLNDLPPYMKPCYEALLHLYSEIESLWHKDRQTKHGELCKIIVCHMQTLVRAYHEEAEWLHKGYLPKYEEYMKVALVTTTYAMLAANCLVCLGDIVTEDSLIWVADLPLILTSSRVICRLMDDMVGYEVEKERGELASAVECYMQEHGASREETFVELEKQIRNAWKDTNKGWLEGLAAGRPMLVTEIILNLSRFMHLLYRNEDGYSNAHRVAKDTITLLLVDPIQI